MNPNLYLPDNLKIHLPVIYSGRDGTAYLDVQQQHVLKVTVLNIIDPMNQPSCLDERIKKLSIVIKEKPYHFVDVIDCNKMFSSSDNKIAVYCYRMQLLQPLNEAENSFFVEMQDKSDCFSDHDVLKDKDFIRNICVTKTSITVEHMQNFCSTIATSNIIHNDIHSKNIMKDNNNQYKLIDLDHITIY